MSCCHVAPSGFISSLPDSFTVSVLIFEFFFFPAGILTEDFFFFLLFSTGLTSTGLNVSLGISKSRTFFGLVFSFENNYSDTKYDILLCF